MFSWKTTIVRATALVGVSLGIGLVHNYSFSREGIRVSQNPAMAASGLEEAVYIPLAEAEALWSEGVVFIDARAEEFYKLDGHIPGAVSVPVGDIDGGLARLEEESVLPDEQIVCYCSNRWCQDASKVASELIARGYSQVLVYEGGWDEWRDAGLPVDGGE